MPRYKLTLAYDGADFCGWQKQEPQRESDGASRQGDQGVRQSDEGEGTGATPSGVPASPKQTIYQSDKPGRIALRTVQGAVERAVREVVREPIHLLGASRTDAGVHARGQVAAFTTTDDPTKIALGSGWPLDRGPDRLTRAINGRLPDDILILAAEPAAPDFDPISHCIAKGYSYTLHVSAVRPLFDRRFVQQIWEPLDLARMNEAAKRLIGEHDFAAFAAAGHGRLSTVRTVFDCAVRELAPDGPSRRLRIDISGSGFLWNMVRIIAGTLVEVGKGKLTPQQVSGAIESKNRRRTGPTLPARGLCLEWIRYS